MYTRNLNLLDLTVNIIPLYYLTRLYDYLSIYVREIERRLFRALAILFCIRELRTSDFSEVPADFDTR